jgi:O-antigen biosynthesis protein
MSAVRRNHQEPPSPHFAPLQAVEIEIGEQLPSLPAEVGSLGVPYAAAVCLVRLHGKPIGYLHIDLSCGSLDAEALAKRLQADLGEEIARHLRRDGLDGEQVLTAGGIAGPNPPPCVGSYDRLVEQAPSVSVVIPTRNRPDSAVIALRSLLRSRYPAERYEVIVVDNASGADAPFVLSEADASTGVPVRVVKERAPGGSNARNAGLRAAEGELVAFVDDDAVVDRYWLGSIVLAFGQGERVAAAAGLIVPREMETPAQLWFEGFVTTVRRFDSLLLDLREPPAESPLFPFAVGDLGSGQNMAFRRDVLIGIGGFDPALGTATPTLGGEDIDALLRVLLADYAVVYEPAAIVTHAQEREFAQVERRVWGYGVGLTACLTKAVLEHPRLVPDLLRKLPRGIAYALDSRSPKNEGKPEDYPRRWTRLELRGMLWGPVAYALARRGVRS